MELKLPMAAEKYDFSNEAQVRRAIEQFARKPLALYSEDRLSGGVIESKFDGDLNATGGYRSILEGWYFDNLVLTGAFTLLPRWGVGTGFPSAYIAERPGSITALAIKLNAARTNGVLSVAVFINGAITNPVLQVQVDGTGSTTFKAITVAKDVLPFVAGDEIDVRYDATAVWAPAGVDMRVTVGVET